MNTRLNISFDEIDFDITVDWNFYEFPRIGDYIEVMDLCDSNDKTHLQNTPLPDTLIDEGFCSTFEYLNYYQWIIIERWWTADSASIVCHKVDPLMA